MNTVVGASLAQQLLPALLSQPAQTVDALLQRANLAMLPTMDSLINQLVPVKPVSGSTVVTAAAVEAVVLKSTALLAPANGQSSTPGNTAASKTQPPGIPQVAAQALTVKNPLLSPQAASSNTQQSPQQNLQIPGAGKASAQPNQQYTITVSTEKQQYEIRTNSPIPEGTRLMLNVQANNLATILSITSGSTSSATTTTQAGLNQTAQSGVAVKTEKVAVSPNYSRLAADNSTHRATLNRATIDQGLRESLPRQQSLSTLIPLVQQLIQQPPAALPKELLVPLIVLARQFPSAQQIQQPAQLKQSLQNSGNFLEAKLAQILAQNNTAPKSAHNSASSQPTPAGQTAINQDVKALIQRLLPLVEKNLIKQSAMPATQSTTRTTANTAVNQPPATSIIQQTLNQLAGTSGTNSDSHQPHPLHTALPELTNTTHSATATQSAQNTAQRNLDIVLRQLGQQLLASLARTQVSQLESLAARQSNSPDGQGPINSWSFEIPITHGKQVDNLALRIDQDYLDEENQDGTQTKKSQWTVMLNFDLHALGRMNVQLNIIEKTVSATVWSQLEKTHVEVKKQVRELKTGLENAGVKVKHIDCQIGVPPSPKTPLYKRLVDVRT